MLCKLVDWFLYDGYIEHYVHITDYLEILMQYLNCEETKEIVKKIRKLYSYIPMFCNLKS